MHLKPEGRRGFPYGYPMEDRMSAQSELECASVIRLDRPELAVCDAHHGCQVARSAVDGMAQNACPSCFAARAVAGA